MDLIILVITCFTNILLGLIVLFRDARRLYARSFAAMSLFICIWIVANLVTNHYIDDLALTSLANRLTYVVGIASVAAGLVFSYNFPYSRKASKVEIGVVGVLTAVNILLGLFTDSISGKVILSHESQLSYPAGEHLWIFIVSFLIILVLMARNLLSVPKDQGEKKRQQARYIFLALVISAFMALVFNVAIPMLTSNWEISRFSPLTMILLVGTIAYTIIKHGLFDIRLAVVRGIAYFLSLLTMAGLYYGLAFAISEVVLQNQVTAVVSLSPLSIGLALLLAFVFQPLKNFFDKYTNRIFYRDNYSVDDFFARLSRELSATTDLHTILQQAAFTIDQIIKPEYAYFFVRNSEGSVKVVGGGYKNRPRASEMTMLDERIGSKSSLIVTDELADEDTLRTMLKEHNVAMTLPLINHTGVLGYLFLGPQKGRYYTQRDVRALETVSDELVIAIQNALSVQEVKEINETLQQRIDEATRELRTTNRQLQQLDEAKDEFVSMASHQLRTPLTSVKGYISMVLEEDAGKITPAQRQLLGEAFASSERMVRLINDFLNVSRLQTGKFILEKHPNNLAKIVAQEVESLQSTAQMHALKLRFKKPPYFPLLETDEAKIRQVLMNFIDNAIYYSHEGTTIHVALSVEDGQAVLRVRDTGIGVPKAEQVHLFSKFFRATNARKQRPDGTGVGLFLAKKVIDAHGGSMLVESEENKGSTFGFRLPIKKLAPKHANDTKELKE